MKRIALVYLTLASYPREEVLGGIAVEKRCTVLGPLGTRNGLRVVWWPNEWSPVRDLKDKPGVIVSEDDWWPKKLKVVHPPIKGVEVADTVTLPSLMSAFPTAWGRVKTMKKRWEVVQRTVARWQAQSYATTNLVPPPLPLPEADPTRHTLAEKLSIEYEDFYNAVLITPGSYLDKSLDLVYTDKKTSAKVTANE